MSTSQLPSRNRFSLILQLASSRAPDSGKKTPLSTPTESHYAPGPANIRSPISSIPEFRNPFASKPEESMFTPAFMPLSPTEMDTSEPNTFLKKAKRMSKILAGDSSDENQNGERGMAAKIARKLSFQPTLSTSASASGQDHSIPNPTSVRPTRLPSNGITRSVNSLAGSRGTTSEKASRPSLDRSVKSFSSTTHDGTASSHSHIPPVPPLMPRPIVQPLSVDLIPTQPSTASFESPVATSMPRPSSASGRRLVKEKRKRRSEEGDTRAASMSAPAGKRIDTKSTPSLRRANSLWADRDRRKAKEGHVEPMPDRASAIKNLREGPFGADSDSAMERKRVLNVKRARKMKEMFGADPPPELYQFSSSAEVPPEPVDVPSRNSAALLSLPPFDMLSVQPSTPRKSRHRSHSSMSSVYSQPSMLSGDLESADPSQTVSSRPPPTPPPFSAYSMQPPPLPIAESQPHAALDLENSTDFRQRRLRAAKLSRFFGVTYQDISSFDQPGAHTPRPSVVAPQPVPFDAPSSPIDVDVRIAEPNRFWARVERRETMREPVDMGAVIHKLRTMR